MAAHREATAVLVGCEMRRGRQIEKKQKRKKKKGKGVKGNARDTGRATKRRTMAQQTGDDTR